MDRGHRHGGKSPRVGTMEPSQPVKGKCPDRYPPKLEQFVSRRDWQFGRLSAPRDQAPVSQPPLEGTRPQSWSRLDITWPTRECRPGTGIIRTSAVRWCCAGGAITDSRSTYSGRAEPWFWGGTSSCRKCEATYPFENCILCCNLFSGTSFEEQGGPLSNYTIVAGTWTRSGMRQLGLWNCVKSSMTKRVGLCAQSAAPTLGQELLRRTRRPPTRMSRRLRDGSKSPQMVGTDAWATILLASIGLSAFLSVNKSFIFWNSNEIKKSNKIT